MTTAAGRIPLRQVDGVLLLDKPLGLSSNAALQATKRLFAAEKAGHTGTLDPLASGLLPICFGDATKFAQALLAADKSYVAEVRFGIATATGDAEGEIVAESPTAFGREDLERVLPRFLGTIAQVPPRYAALKFQGRNYYEYARAGIEIERVPRGVAIHALRVLAWAPPFATLEVACGKGTYIRVLAEDIAHALGSCAHLTALRRTATGPFRIDGAASLDALARMEASQRDALLLPVHAPLVGMPRLDVDAEAALALLQGRAATAPPGPPGHYRCFDARGRFVGIVEIAGENLRAVRLVRTPLAEAR